MSQVEVQPDEPEDYRAIFEATGDGVIIADMDGHPVDVNPAFCQMHGYSREEMLTVFPTQFIHPSYHAVFADYMASLNRGTSYRTTALDVRKDGTVFPVEVNGTVFTYRGTPHALGIVRDVSDRVAAEEQLREREEQYRSIVESTTDGLLIRSVSGCIVEANPAACRMYGYTQEELRGLPVGALIHPDDRHVILDTQQDLDSDQTFQARLRHLRKDGSTIYVDVHAAGFLYTGEPHVLAVIRDVTASVAAEHAVREERHRLSRELHDSVTQALFSITLQIRTAQLQLEREGANSSGPLAQSLKQTRHLAQGALAEMRALIFELRPDVIEQEGLAAALRRHAAAVTARHEVEIDVVMAGEPAINAPAKEALYRIAQEAVQNAVTHAQPGRVVLRVERRGTDVVLEVRDNGAGFDPDASFPGHLGLLSMQERAERVGGGLEIQSEVGAGTVVQVRVPLPLNTTTRTNRDHQ